MCLCRCLTRIILNWYCTLCVKIVLCVVVFEILQFRAKLETAMVSPLRFVWITILLHTNLLPNLLAHEAMRPSGLDNYFVCKRFAVQILLWSLEFAIHTNLKHDTIAVSSSFLSQLFKKKEEIINAKLQKINNKWKTFLVEFCVFQ